MSIIRQLNEEKRKRQEIETDLKTVSIAFKEAWESLGIDFSKFATGDNSKPSMAQITKISLQIGKSILSGKIKIEDLVKKWEALEPIFKKHEHLIKDQAQNDGRD